MPPRKITDFRPFEIVSDATFGARGGHPAAIVLAIESLHSRHSQIGRRRGSTITRELAEHALSQHGF